MDQPTPEPRTADIAIAGAGIIGLSLALELRRRGLSVIVLERAQAMSSASSAAGGMLAVHDPQNPPALLPLSLLSSQLYPEYLAHIESLSGKQVPLRTRHTLQYITPGTSIGRPATPSDLADLAPGLLPEPHTFALLEESSLDPHDLRAALPAAFRAAGGILLEQTDLLHLEAHSASVHLRTSAEPIAAAHFIDCRGAWSGFLPGLSPVPVVPVKGQMTNLRCPPDRLRCAIRAPGVYLIPRGDGRLAVGSTLERVGFNQQPQSETGLRLAEAARQLIPEAQPQQPPQIWAGLRPAAPDDLPILGPAPEPHCWHATGHYRDGILLAPATARVLAQAILNEPTDVPLDPYSPHRF
ncbi:MAG TPA: FAD-dependent oxidoreductase [Acidobacteriaceae bacterium]|nr:FAD-dependent oxidoreductase [Acidobacteriaceae bacterium]